MTPQVGDRVFAARPIFLAFHKVQIRENEAGIVLAIDDETGKPVIQLERPYPQLASQRNIISVDPGDFKLPTEPMDFIVPPMPIPYIKSCLTTGFRYLPLALILGAILSDPIIQHLDRLQAVAALTKSSVSKVTDSCQFYPTKSGSPPMLTALHLDH